MGVRLINTHISPRQTVKWRVEIHDTDFSATPLPFLLRGSGFQLSYDGADNPFTAILPSKVILPIVVQDNSLDSFISDIISAQEDRFFVVIRKGNSENLYWTGRILIEQFQRENRPHPFIFKVAAIDGLALLKDIDYNNNGVPYFFHESIKEQLFKALDKIGLNHLYGTADTFLTTSVAWQAVGQVLTSSEDAIIKTKANHDAFWKRSIKGEYTYKSSFDVLQEFCTLFAARLFQAEGEFRFVQVGQHGSIQFQEISYNATGGFLQAANAIIRTKSFNTSNNIKLGGGIFRYLPAITTASNNYIHRGSNNYIAGVKWAHNIKDTYSLGDIETEGNVNDKLLVKMTLEWDSFDINSIEKPYLHRWKIILKVGDFYLKRTATISTYNLSYTTAEFTETPSYYEIVSRYIDPVERGNSGVIDISFKTPQLRGAGVGSIQLDTFGSFNMGGDSIVMNLNYNAYNSSVELLREGNTTDREEARFYELLNEDTGNSFKIELNTLLGDGPTAQSVGRLKIDTGVGLYANSEGWNTNNGNEQELIQKLVLLEIMKVRKKPITLFENQIQSSIYSPAFALNYDDFTWVFLSGTLNSNTDTWAGTWFNLSSFVGGVAFVPDKQIAPTVPIAIVENPFVVDDAKVDTNLLVSLLEATKNAVLNDKVESDIALVELPTADGGIIGLQSGDTARIISPTTGLSETFLIEGITATGNLQINTTFTNNYPEGSTIIKDILTPVTIPAIQTAKLQHQVGSTTDVDFDLPETEIDEQLYIIRAGRQVLEEWDYTISNNEAGERKRINWKIPLFTENIYIKLTT